MNRAITISTTGEKALVEFTEETSYDTIRNAVGGYIECICLPSSKGIEMWVNEEGKLLNLDQNPTGTALWNDNYDALDVTVGNIIITGGTDDEGETLGLTDEQITFVMGYDKSVVIENLDLSAFTGFTVVSLPNN